MSNGVIRFEEFELDRGAFELRRGGRAVRLERIPLELLFFLAEHRGLLIGREEILERIWGKEVFVDADNSINTAVRKIRQALKENPDEPRYLQTVPGKGYRFVAPIDDVPMAAPPRLGESRAPEALAESQVRRRHWQLWLALPAVLACAGAILVGSAVLRRPKPNPGKVMLAVLPFQNMSNDPGQEYFSDGLTEETITDLGQLSPEHLGVVARTSAMAYKHTNKSVSQIGRELGVDYILEGSVRRDGGEARISAQLIRVSDQTHVWAQNYQRELHDLLQVQNELGTAIARQVQGNLTPQQLVDLSKIRSVDPEAYDLYLRGRFYWNERNPAAIKQSIGYFQQAIAKDGNFALAYVGLADAYNIGNIMGAFSAKDSLPKAKVAATKALTLDPSLAEAHAALGMEKSHYEFDFPGAEKEFLKAIELNPNSAYAHLFYSNCYLAPMGRMQEAIAENKKAVELDPLSLPINNFLAMTYMFAGDYEKSYQQFQHTIAMNPTFPLAHEYFSFLLKLRGRFEEGIQEHEKSDVLGGSSPEDAAAEANLLRQALKNGGEKGLWQKTLEVTLAKLERSKPEIVSPGFMASVYALAGDKDNAFQWLDKAYSERDGEEITLLRCDPTYKNLRADPRFNELLRRMGLPE